MSILSLIPVDILFAIAAVIVDTTSVVIAGNL